MHPFHFPLWLCQVMVYGANSCTLIWTPNKSQPIGGVRPTSCCWDRKKPLAIGDFPGISVLVPIAICFVLLVWFILNKTVFERTRMPSAETGRRQSYPASTCSRRLWESSFWLPCCNGVAGVLKRQGLPGPPITMATAMKLMPSRPAL